MLRIICVLNLKLIYIVPFLSDASAALSSSLAQTIHDVAQCSTHTPYAESSHIHTLYLTHQPCAPLHEHRQIVEGVLVSVGEAMCLNRFLRRGTSSLLHRPHPSTSALWTSKSIRKLKTKNEREEGRRQMRRKTNEILVRGMIGGKKCKWSTTRRMNLSNNRPKDNERKI